MAIYTRPAGLDSSAVMWYDSDTGQIVNENNIIGEPVSINSLSLMDSSVQYISGTAPEGDSDFIDLYNASIQEDRKLLLKSYTNQTQLESFIKLQNPTVSNVYAVTTTFNTHMYIGPILINYGLAAVTPGSASIITLDEPYTRIGDYTVQAISYDGNHPGATRGAQGVRILNATQIYLAKAQFNGNYMYYFTIGRKS